MLGTLGLGEREQDDFTMFWAKDVLEGGGVVVARVVPESDLNKCAELKVSARVSEGGAEVPVSVHRVYVTMAVCKSLPDMFAKNRDKLRRIVSGSKTVELPAELGSSFPMKRDPNTMTVVEWGGIVMKL